MKYVLLICLLFLGSFGFTNAQVLDPNDPVITYDPDNPPPVPPYGTLAKWVRTKRVNWNTDNFKCYYYNGMPFRLRFPKNYDPSSNKKYPIIVMLPGRGESGEIYDNENNLKHAARDHERAILNNEYDGFLMFPQSINGYWGEGYLNNINTLVNNHFQDINVDRDRVILHGLSSGGQGVWEFISDHPKTFAAALPMSASSTIYYSGINKFKYIPLWLSQGGKDSNPTPFTSSNLVDEIVSRGGNIRYTLYKNLGHGVWNAHYGEKDFWPFINRAHKTVPVVMNGELTLVSTSDSKDIYEFLTKEELCPGENIQVRLGLTAGFQGYQWRKNGAVISGANSNEFVATEYGTYDARFKRDGVWSPWSVRAIEVKEKAATITPDIQVRGLASKVLPAPDGSTTVELELPEGYVAYGWKRINTNNIISNQRVFSASSGEYIATVTEQFGCSSSFSSPFKVIDANGSNPPPALSNAAGFALSKTSISLQWAKVSNPSHPATHFEIYRSTTSGSDYSLIDIIDASLSQYTDENLLADTYYYYIIRPVNNNAAAPVSNEVAVKTEVDNNAPTAPLNLVATSTSPTQISLSWNAATDDVGVYRYDVYKNGVKSVVSESTSATVFNLQEDQVYRFQVIARDLTGNESPLSNQVVAPATLSGINYRYYHGRWSSLPDFNELTPELTGQAKNFDIGVRTQNNDFAFYFEGFIKIPVAGNYTFETRSDDGSKLYIGGYGDEFEVVNNDGLHGNRYREGTYNFPAPGNYKIIVTFFERGGGENLQVYWKNTAHGIGNNRQEIPDAAFGADFDMPGTPPESPTGVVATAVSYNTIDLNWQDNSNNETAFQIYRAESALGPFLPVATTQPDVSSYSDSDLEADKEYFYIIIALGQYGASGSVKSIGEVIGDINHGIAAQDNAGGDGYILFSKESVHQRFSSNRPNRDNSDHLIAVKLINNQWHYDNNNNYYPFTPVDSDVLLAEVSFSGDNITGLEGTSGMIEGIESGFASGDLSFYAQRWNGGNNNGEFTIEGTSFRRNGDNSAFATTLPLPPAPSAPTNTLAEAVSTTHIQLSWSSVSNSDAYIIYRSLDNNQNYLPIDEVPASASSQVIYNDEGLTPHTLYYYQIEAYNVGGNATSTDFSVSTQNNSPELDEIQDMTIRHGVVFNLQLYGSDEDEDPLSYTSANLPGFATLTDYGDGTGLLKLEPSSADEGIFNNISITLNDGFGGSDTHTFDLIVNDNYLPEINPIADITIPEGSNSTISVQASDTEGAENLTWSSTLPDFAQLNVNVDGTASLTLSPDFTMGGTHPASITVEDADGGTATESFNIIVTEENPNTLVRVNFTDGSLLGGQGWNNTSGHPQQGDSYQNLIDISGNTTSFGLTISSFWNANGSNTLGSNTGNNSGIYPDNVLQSSYWSNSGTRTITLSGLDDSRSYTLTFFGSRAANDDRSTRYSSQGNNVVLNTASNTNTTVSIENLIPVSGEISFSMERAGASNYGYLNALIIEEKYDDGNAPASPGDLIATFDSDNQQVAINWNDRAFNESGYYVYKSNSQAGPFTRIADLVGESIESYFDTDVSANNSYYYQVSAYNSNGESGQVGPVVVEVPNIAPIISTIDDITIELGTTSLVSISASDDPSDQITLSTTNLPSFVTFNDNGGGSGTLSLSPEAGSLGEYTVSVVAEDQNGGSNTETFIINVVPSGLSSYYINFAGTSQYSAASPWHNYIGSGSSGDVLNGITAQGNNGSISMQLLDSWNGNNSVGMTGSSLYPDNVTRTSIWTGDSQNKRIRISGLSLDNAYNFTFFGSRNGGGNRTTEYAIGGSSVSLNASYNQNETVTIEGIVPNSSGEIVINMNRAAGASYGYINALVIEGYQATAIPSTPTDLVATPVDNSSIAINWQDNTNLETAYEVWRSTVSGSGFSLTSTLPLGSTSYTDNSVQKGVTYYYKVRANLSDGSQSEFSNESGASTVNMTVSLNINVTEPQAEPWNNTNSFPDPGLVFSNLRDENQVNTGISFEIVEENPMYDPSLYGFSGDNPFGEITGNDSGVVPDNVMRSTWWMDPGKTAELRFFNLDLSQSYNFTFFASRDGNGDRTSVYSIGGESAKLNAANNTSNVAKITNVTANENGEILVSITSDVNSMFSYIGAIIIEASNNTSATNARKTDSFVKNAESSSDHIAESDILIGNTSLTIYPNPYAEGNSLNLAISNCLDQELSISIYDARGVLVHEQHNSGLSESHNIEIDLNRTILRSGVYMVKISGQHTGTTFHRLLVE